MTEIADVLRKLYDVPVTLVNNIDPDPNIFWSSEAARLDPAGA